MKKQSKKLNLNKETLRSLETAQLEHLAGGAPTDFCITNQGCNSVGLRCPSDTTCGTYYC